MRASRDALREQWMTLFRRMDTDMNGKITFKEFIDRWLDAGPDGGIALLIDSQQLLEWDPGGD